MGMEKNGKRYWPKCSLCSNPMVPCQKGDVEEHRNWLCKMAKQNKLPRPSFPAFRWEKGRYLICASGPCAHVTEMVVGNTAPD